MNERPELEYNPPVDEYIRRIHRKHMKQNGREINRLKNHMYECLITNNINGYVYALEKIRRLCLQSALPVDVMESMYRSSKMSVDELVYKTMRGEDIAAEGI